MSNDPQQQQLTDLLVKSATQHLKLHDYEAAVREFEKIPVALRTDNVSYQLANAKAARDEVASLRQQIVGAVNSKRFDGLLKKTARLLDLSPQNTAVQKLHQQLVEREQKALDQATELPPDAATSELTETLSPQRRFELSQEPPQSIQEPSVLPPDLNQEVTLQPPELNREESRPLSNRDQKPTPVWQPDSPPDSFSKASLFTLVGVAVAVLLVLGIVIYRGLNRNVAVDDKRTQKQDKQSEVADEKADEERLAEIPPEERKEEEERLAAEKKAEEDAQRTAAERAKLNAKERRELDSAIQNAAVVVRFNNDGQNIRLPAPGQTRPLMIGTVQREYQFNGKTGTVPLRPGQGVAFQWDYRPGTNGFFTSRGGKNMCVAMYKIPATGAESRIAEFTLVGNKEIRFRWLESSTTTYSERIYEGRLSVSGARNGTCTFGRGNLLDVTQPAPTNEPEDLETKPKPPRPPVRSTVTVSIQWASKDLATGSYQLSEPASRSPAQLATLHGKVDPDKLELHLLGVEGKLKYTRSTSKNGLPLWTIQGLQSTKPLAAVSLSQSEGAKDEYQLVFFWAPLAAKMETDYKSLTTSILKIDHPGLKEKGEASLVSFFERPNSPPPLIVENGRTIEGRTWEKDKDGKDKIKNRGVETKVRPVAEYYFKGMDAECRIKIRGETYTGKLAFDRESQKWMFERQLLGPSPQTVLALLQGDNFKTIFPTSLQDDAIFLRLTWEPTKKASPNGSGRLKASLGFKNKSPGRPLHKVTTVNKKRSGPSGNLGAAYGTIATGLPAHAAACNAHKEAVDSTYYNPPVTIDVYFAKRFEHHSEPVRMLSIGTGALVD